MADSARQSPPDLNVAGRPGAAYDFFELLRQLEREGGVFGYSGPASREPARLGQHVRMVFATHDVAAFQPASEGRNAKVTVANIGLLGPEGPLPLHLTRWVLDRLSQRWFAAADLRETSDTTFLDFVNVLQHRLMALYYRAWADAHPAVQVERRIGGRVRSMLQAMAGIGLPGTDSTSDPSFDVVKLMQAGGLAQTVDAPERLTHYLAAALNVPVQLKEFVASWIDVPAHLQSRVGLAHAGLGRGATIGPRVFTRQSRVELRIGPVGLETYRSFLRGGAKLPMLKRLVRDLVGDQFDVDLRLVLARDAVPAAKIGGVELGRTGWLARPRERGDADDLRMRTIVGWRPELAEAAA